MAPMLGALGIVLGLSALSSTVMPSPVAAWGDQGHRIVARIADSFLSPGTRAAVVAILGDDPYFTVCARRQHLPIRTRADKLACVATWADSVKNSEKHRKTAPLHFVNIPIGATPPAYDEARDCARGCVITAVERYKVILADPRNAKRGEALKFLVHFVADLHQPLHTAVDIDRDADKPENAMKLRSARAEGDRGGNLKLVTWLGEGGSPFGCWNLHAVWDDGIISKSGLGERDSARSLLKALTPDRAALLRQGDPVLWANEALGLAIRQAYGTLPVPDNSDKACEIPDGHDKRCAADRGQACAAAEVHSRYHLGIAYYAANRPVVEAQLSAAGVRLAMLLDQALR